MTEGTEISRQAVTEHLRVLEGAGLVRGVREGRENVYELEPRRLAQVRQWLDVIADEGDARLDRLRAFLER